MSRENKKMNHVPPLWEVSAELSLVAMGKTPADFVIRNARLVNVCTGEILPGTDVAIAHGRVALVGDASHCVGESTQTIDAGGRYIVPGFLDGHVHLESSMMTAEEYARAVLPHGTTGVFMDPHEIANVLGLDGIRCIMEDAGSTPLRVYTTTPSCVPAVPGLEDSGAALYPADIAGTMCWEDVIGLGEMMNFPGILAGDANAHAMVGETLKAGKIPTGHYADPETGKGLNAYIAAGLRCCHESTRAEDALAKMRLGMYAQIREGSAWRDLHEVSKAVTQNRVDTRFACLVSDDMHPNTLIQQGHMDYIVRRAVEEGIDAVTAIQMATINTAQCFRMDHEIGSITPGKRADILLLSSLERAEVIMTMIGGQIVAREGRCLFESKPSVYPEQAMHSVHLPNAITPDDFIVRAPDGASSSVVCRVIDVTEAKVNTREMHIALPVKDGAVQPDPEADVLAAAVIERHKNTGTVGLGFVKGFHIQRGAIASTYAHDAHNLMVLGANRGDMAVCANALRECQGGMCAALDGKVIGLLALPIAGLMSDKPADETVAALSGLEEAWSALGCDMESPFMTMALVALACIPELRLTNRGLVDCRTFEFTELFV